MTDIKFRAFEKNLQQMIEVDGINFKMGIIYPGDTWRYLNEVVLMQSTGITNEDGVEIYEGDVVKIVSGSNPRLYWLYVIGTVEQFGNNLFALDFENNLGSSGDFFTYEVTRYLNGGRAYINKDMKVIGNIYENPELVVGTEWE